jgi:hypothetical protein
VGRPVPADRCRAARWVLLLGVLALLVPAGCAVAAPAEPAGYAAAGGGPEPLPPLPVVRPVGLTAPTIGVAETELVDLERLPGGELEVPVDFARAGWFVDGAVPGSAGPAVIAGHVDSRSGPAVFYRLRDLRPGDPIDVALSDGSVAGFVVDDVVRFPKDAFPTAAVYGPVPGAALRLITCGGGFDPALRSYRDNIVVFASPR